MKITFTLELPPHAEDVLKKYCKKLKTTPETLIKTYVHASFLFASFGGRYAFADQIIKESTVRFAGGPEVPISELVPDGKVRVR